MAKPRKPKRRLVVARSSNNDKRRLREPVPPTQVREALVARARFAGSGKHKLSPRAFGLEPAHSDEDDTFCDGHAGFRPEDMARIGGLLRRGLLAGLIGQHEKQGDPTLIWTVDDNGWIYEGRITTPSQAVYHAYPLLPSDAFAKIVIARYSEWACAQSDTEPQTALQNVLDRYP